MSLTDSQAFQRGGLTLLGAVRIAKFCFGPVRLVSAPGFPKVWTYSSTRRDARHSMGRDYAAICQCRNREILHAALVLMGWDKDVARQCADEASGRGTMHAQVQSARAWRRNMNAMRKQRAA